MQLQLMRSLVFFLTKHFLSQEWFDQINRHDAVWYQKGISVNNLNYFSRYFKSDGHKTKFVRVLPYFLKLSK